MAKNEPIRSLLDFAVEAAWQAGKITLHYFQTDISADSKADGTVVTVADRRSEERLRSMIEKRFPEHGILGEEFGERKGSSPHVWIIDPIDGTSSFVRGVPLYGVLMGLEIDGEMKLGVINCPAIGDMVYAAKGEGCYWNGRRASVSGVSRLSEAVLLSTDITRTSEVRGGIIYERLKKSTKVQRTWGDCYGYLLVATGRAEIMMDAQMSPWDAAALKPVLEEAGGTLTDWSGVATIYGGNAIATNGKLFDSVMELMK
jgi:histidinol phosphatase-like enzyme (inositol monophosphatase family)